jgi:uncharacterized protein GlcG (DUF336 family)
MLTYDMARRMLDAAVAHASQRGLTMTIAVVDQAGVLVALARMDGASFLGPEVARGKAYGSAAFRIPSAELAERAEASPVFYTSLVTLSDGRFVAAQGGLPIRIGGQVVGAIAASGNKPPVDEDVARAGLAAVTEAS